MYDDLAVSRWIKSNNLTGVIGANVTLIQPWHAGTISVLGGTIIGAILSGGFNC